MRTTDAVWIAPGEPQEIQSDLVSRFQQEYGRAASGTWFAPGRANLNGEHIDFHAGRCLPMALSHGTYVAAAPRTDGRLRLRTLDASLDDGVTTVNPDQIGPEATPEEAHWSHYVSGVLWALRELGRSQPTFAVDEGFGADLLVVSTLPIGGGLSSSAALECASILAFLALGTPFGQDNPLQDLNAALTRENRRDLAAACVRAEVEVVGAGTGGLDQTAAMRARPGKVLSLDCRDFSVTPLDIGCILRGYRLIAVDTGEAHRLADGQFGDRRADAEAAARLLGFDRLRDALPERPRKADVSHVLEEFDRLAEQLETLQGRSIDACRRRLRHALTEMVRSEKLHHLLSGEAYGVRHIASTVGGILTAGHMSMRDDAEVSFDVADLVVETALAQGAEGARLIGGGFGGSVLVLITPAAIPKLTVALERISRGIRLLDVAPSSAAQAL
ncbi:galactokinase [Nesterenkonia aurantiaca]|uniref:Galactokinase n=1 Tax=Nesterenkonia aurantiaca TaxID=1436010 RepID=A0A4V3ECJ8_9MICC|nr:galactokinase family protein [Nesterenkonia aurantiaca]TDS86782.1 galactokinase [Nesterenkonia aurantiaca]